MIPAIARFIVNRVYVMNRCAAIVNTQYRILAIRSAFLLSAISTEGCGIHRRMDACLTDAAWCRP